MDFDSAREKLTDVFQQAFSLVHPTVPVRYENHPFSQPRDGAWVDFSMQPNVSMRANVGVTSPLYKHHGIINIQIMVPQDTGTALANDISQACFNILADKKMALPGGGYLTTYGVKRRVRGVINGYHSSVVVAEYCQTATKTG